MRRLYESVLQRHYKDIPSKMFFLSGPRQVGKTTVTLSAKDWGRDFYYYNWDNLDHRDQIIKGPKEIAIFSELDNSLQGNKKIIVFDEIHKYSNWKIFLKGFFDTYGKDCQILVTGSSRLNIYKKGGDSLMGRYFPYRMHPISLREINQQEIPQEIINKPVNIPKDHIDNLFNFGGFPEPFLKASESFSKRWQKLKNEMLFREDIRDVSRIQEIGQMELLAKILAENASCQLSYSNLSKLVRVSVDTIRRWIEVLESFYYCYRVTPYHKNVVRSLIKEPKIYLWDWSNVVDKGAKVENFVAGHLKKFVQFWNDLGEVDLDLHYIRDKSKKEVDFLVTKEGRPWFLVEVKTSSSSDLSPNLEYFQTMLQADHAFQVVYELDYIDRDCFQEKKPIKVPLSTFLSQLI